MIIDAHTHVYLRPVVSSNPRLWVFMSAEKQIALMDRLGIDKAIIQPLNNAEAPAECQSHGEILTICERYPDRFIPFCNIDPRLPRDPAQTTVDDYLHYLRQYRDLGCRGLGELTARMRWHHPLMRLLLRACEIVGFPVTFHMTLPGANGYGVIDDPDFSGLERALADFPGVVFLGHSPTFWRGISGGEGEMEKPGYPCTPVEPGGPVMRLFRTYPNLYGDLSGGSGLTALTRDREQAYGFLNELSGRLVFGLDCNSSRHPTDLLPFLNTACAEGHISETVRDKILSGNSVRLCGL
jgi:uncharacterized protein